MSTERREFLSTRRQNQRFVIGRVGKVMLDSVDRTLEYAPSSVDRSVRPSIPSNPDTYETLALCMYTQYVQATDNTPLDSSRPLETIAEKERRKILEGIRKSESIANGFTVMGRVLSFVPEAYKIFCDNTGEAPTMAGLRTILKNDKSFEKTIGFLSNMPSQINRVWEEHLCVTGSLYTAARTGILGYPMLKISGEDELPYLDIGTIPRRGAVTEVYQLGLEKQPGKNCSARGVYLPKLWQEMSDICCTDPALFASELNIEPLPVKA